MTLLWTSPPGELDATLLRLDRPVTGPEPFPVAARLPANDGKQKVYVIGHPKGGGLSLSLTDNAILDYDERLMHYRAPTEGGSSGSPVFNNQWRLVALHHAGGSNVPKLNGRRGKYDANEGSRSSGSPRRCGHPPRPRLSPAARAPGGEGSLLSAGEHPAGRQHSERGEPAAAHPRGDAQPGGLHRRHRRRHQRRDDEHGAGGAQDPQYAGPGRCHGGAIRVAGQDPERGSQHGRDTDG